MSAPGGGPPGDQDAQRLDKWLWYARVAKSRTLAARLISDGKIRVNRARVVKPGQLVKPGDVITSAARETVRILRVKAPGVRRGPAAEAQGLYNDLTPPPAERPREAPASGSRLQGTGRPTKRDRRLIDLFKGRER